VLNRAVAWGLIDYNPGVGVFDAGVGECVEVSG
jgi:hypothetical protein